MQTGEPETSSSAPPPPPVGLAKRHPDLPHGVQDPPPKFPPGLRTVFYLLSALSLQSIVTSILAVWILGSETLQALAEGDPSVSITLDDQILLRSLAAPAVLVLTFLFIRTIDRKRITDVGIWPIGEDVQTAVRQLLLTIGGALVLLTLWRLLASFAADFVPSSELPLAGQSSTGLSLVSLIGYAVGFLIIAALEEIMFRGYIYAAVRERFAWIHTAGWTSLLFVFLNIGHSEITAIGILNTCLFGLLLGALREWDGHVWGATLFHASWNFALGCILALPISGIRVPSVRPIEAQGPAALTGGPYGPEASWLLTPFLIALLLLLSWLLQQRGERLQPDEASDPEAAAE